LGKRSFSVRHGVVNLIADTIVGLLIEAASDREHN